MQPANENYRSWWDRVATLYPGRIMVVLFFVSIPVGMVLFPSLAWLFNLGTR